MTVRTASGRGSARHEVHTVEWNRDFWSRPEYWAMAGDDWSSDWGGPRAQWFGSIHPRVARYLPASRVLEIAPGYGRWTQFLLANCDTLVGVDLAERCVAACSQRFADEPRARFVVNDGRSLGAVADRWIDLAFSYDSLVHAEAGVMAAYIDQLATKLADEGVAFIHHSNAAEYRRSLENRRHLKTFRERVSPRLRRILEPLGVLDWDHERALTVSAELVANMCDDSGLRCVSQELVNWGCARLLIDCISVIARPGSRWDHPRRLIANRHFMDEAESIRLAASAHGT